jgi:hypothetical protein
MAACTRLGADSVLDDERRIGLVQPNIFRSKVADTLPIKAKHQKWPLETGCRNGAITSDAGLATAGSSLDRQKGAIIRAIVTMQFDEQCPRNDACCDPGTEGPGCVSPTPQLQRE